MILPKGATSEKVKGGGEEFSGQLGVGKNFPGD